jgi:pimeloyl-ACP methyl ester carboxylesterase
VIWRGLKALEIAWPEPYRLGHELRAPANADPVILVAGYANTDTPGWDEWSRSLTLDGFRTFLNPPPTHGLGDMYASAVALADYIEQVKRATGAKHVNVIGFSEGGLLARMAASEFGEASSINRIITLASPHNGIHMNGVVDAVNAISPFGSPFPDSTMQLVRGSALIRRLDAADAAERAHGHIRYWSIHSRVGDGFVSPWAARLAGAVDVPIGPDGWWHGFGGPTHFGMYHLSDKAYEAARGALLTGASSDD